MKKNHHWLVQASRFVLVGLSAACVDWTLYRFAFWLTTIIPLSKAIGFIMATAYAYTMNRLWTFNAHAHAHKGVHHAAKFIFVYLITLALNVGTNSFLLHVMDENPYRLALAFIGATAVSSTLNFLGMKFYVFPPK